MHPTSIYPKLAPTAKADPARRVTNGGLAMDRWRLAPGDGPGPHPVRTWARPVVGMAGVIIAYYSIPVSWADDHPFLALLQTVAGIALLAWAILGQVRQTVQKSGDRRGPTFAILLTLVLAVFAYGYLVLQNLRPGEMVGLSTRTDSLYFTLQVLTTVGLGDVHASGQVARALVSIQMIFDVVFVAIAGSFILSAAQTRLVERPGPPRHVSAIDHRRDEP